MEALLRYITYLWSNVPYSHAAYIFIKDMAFTNSETVNVIHFFGIDYGHGFEKLTIRSIDPSVGSLYYYGTLFFSVKIFIQQLLLCGFKHMFKSFKALI